MTQIEVEGENRNNVEYGGIRRPISWVKSWVKLLLVEYFRTLNETFSLFSPWKYILINFRVIVFLKFESKHKFSRKNVEKSLLKSREIPPGVHISYTRQYHVRKKLFKSNLTLSYQSFDLAVGKYISKIRHYFTVMAMKCYKNCKFPTFLKGFI